MLAPPNFKQLRHNMRTIVSSGKTWLTAIYGCFMFAPTITLGALWGVSFLLKQYPGIDKPHAAELVSFLFFGWACGSPLFGLFSDWLQRRKPPLYLSTLGSLVCSVFILYCPDLPYSIMGILLFLFGLFSSGFVLAFSICRELHEFRFSGSALGFMNMMNALGAALIPPLAGILLDLSLKGEHVHGSIDPYTLSNFKMALTLVPVCFIISCIILPFIPETRAKSIV